MKSLFVTYEFDDHCKGLSGRFSAERLYGVNSPDDEAGKDQVEKLVADVFRIAKTTRNYVITFDSFGIASTSLLRISAESFSVGSDFSVISWKYNQYGAVMETTKTDPCKVNMRSIRKAVAEALRLFQEDDE